MFDSDRLGRLAATSAAGFTTADPFPHAVIDDFLRPDSAAELARVFPRPDDPIAWDHFGARGLEMKMGSSHEERFPAPLRNAVHDLNSGMFVRFLERLTGIDHLLPDPHLVGGGLHLSRAGDHLGIHADFNWHEKLEAHRRLNLLIYLTPDWRPEYGGELELWDTRTEAMRQRIEPLFNRAVIFTTRSDTFHGHPNPWAAPEPVLRQSIAMYYYTTTRPAEEIHAPHNTRYKGYHF
ncbi:MAG TPA: 2OG-Fe(II) oxygenase [Rhodanobacteraceae bacterium]|nr:2OG-Fe(II) oxygenase [Rhodanobacteraceae bacterium]